MGADPPEEAQTVPMKKRTQQLIAEMPRKRSQVELTIGIDLDNVWSHYCTLNQQGEVVDRDRFRTTPKAIDKWFIYVPQARVRCRPARIRSGSASSSSSWATR